MLEWVGGQPSLGVSIYLQDEEEGEEWLEGRVSLQLQQKFYKEAASSMYLIN